MLWMLVLGCPWVGDTVYDERVRDLDGDGGISERFGGPDCVDDNPDIDNCDADQDGFRTVAAGGTDCDDSNASIHPDARETCNPTVEVDEDCDGLVGDADPDVLGQLTWYLDADGDGIGGDVSVLSCNPPQGYVPSPGDCNDADPTISPAELERCDNVDRDCDGDLRAGATNPIDWYLDTDGDSFGGAFSGTSCEPPNATDVENDQDCDDADPAATTPQVFYQDDDGDGFGLDALAQQACTVPDGYATVGGDCDDSNVVRYPFALEICDGIDNDCDLLIDDEDTNTFSPPTWYADADNDGFTVTVDFVVQCVPPAGYTVASTLADCNDQDPAINPNQVERCDDTATDDDCDGLVNAADPDFTGITYYLDSDQDGFGTGAGTVACEQPFGYATLDGDCNDQDPSINPETTWYQDADGDGYGSLELSTVACNPPGGFALSSTDCNDNELSVNPGQAETCGAFDEDCDGLLNDDDPSLSNGIAHRFDADGDGAPGGGAVAFFCGDPSPGWVPASRTADCDDGDPTRHPQAAEVFYDGFDQNCDPADEFDADGDGYDCSPIVDVRCPVAGDDCDDARASVHPGATEVWYDDIDDDCDGNRYDADGDGFAARLPSGVYVDDDADDDGVHDLLELNLYGTDPTLVDSDGGGEPDGHELAAGRDPTDADDDQPVAGDMDADGLSDALELQNGSDPQDPDSDDDGLLDGFEVHDLALEPTVANTDCNDQDGLQYAQVFALHTDGTAERLGANPPPGCDLVALAEPEDTGLPGFDPGIELEDLVGCTCEVGVALDPGTHPGDVELEGRVLFLTTAGVDPTQVEALIGPDARSACQGPGTQIACVAAEVSIGDPGGSVFRVAGGPSPDFPDVQVRGQLVLNGVVVTGGVGSVGAGVRVEEGGVLTATSSVFVDNFAYLRGGAIGVEAGGQVDLDLVTIAGNLSLGAGAGLSSEGGVVTIDQALFFSNQGTGSGAIDTELGTIALRDARLELNTSPQLRIQQGMGQAVIARTLVLGAPAQGGSPPSDEPQVEIRAGSLGPVEIRESAIRGGEAYLSVASPTTVEQTAMVGSAAIPAVLADDTLLVLRRSFVFGSQSPVVLFERSTGLVEKVAMPCPGTGCSTYIESAGEASLFGPSVVDNLFQGPPDNISVFGFPVYLGDLGSEAPTACFDASCSSMAGNANLAGAVELVRFHPDLDPTVWDLHAPVGSPLIGPGIDIGVFDHATYHVSIDGDALPDGWELDSLGTRAFGPGDDPDGDGLNNQAEYDGHTHPALADTDGDGVDDPLDSAPLNPGVQ